ncbi:hypothetical protein [Umboniibacter marinipuniceus]|uniref:Uncharacterized protein n=1 Tax=Umboniibacter marinipuniceus TaxID=569599 RepID=A0A3M0AC05_9GAMM|nr:hypothetical protein [Umboniibacter marinipuniceus]RMA82691.1 hypothetical protein DFR27_0648 [Umboniibacter marinipuniceus]
MWDIISSVATAIGSILTAIGVFLAGRQLRIAQTQSITEFEDSFDQQYRALTMEIPVDVLLGKPVKPEEREDVRELIFNYLDLANEQVFLRSENRILDATWRSWKEGIKSNLSKQGFEEVFDEVRGVAGFTYLERLVETEFQTDPRQFR